MKIKKDDFIKGLMEHLMGNDAPQVLVGELTPDLIKQKKQMEKETDKLVDDISMRGKELQLQMERQIREEFGERKDAVEELRENFWDNVYSHFNVDPDKHYTVKKGKTLYMEVDDDELDSAVDEKELH